MSDLRLPGDRNRTAIIGQTESGKTVMAVYLLSRQNFTEMPWYVINSKEDDFIDSIEGTEERDLEDEIETHPGIYIIRPRPEIDDEALNDFLMRVWESRNCGIVVDEGYMVSGSKGYNLILYTGRSRRIPVIALSQRPVYMSLYTFTEASFFFVFALTIQNDRKKIEEYTPINEEDFDGLRKHWCWYYDVGERKKKLLQPAPAEAKTRKTIEERLASIPRRSRRFGT